MIFKKRFITKWHDTDAERKVRATMLLVYMQEVSNLHMGSCGPSLDALRDEKGLAFILSKIRFAVYRPLYAFEEIEVQTWTVAPKGFAITRFYRIVRGDEIIAEADSTWALLDLNTSSIVKGEICESVYSFEHEPELKVFEGLEVNVPARFKLPREITLREIGKRSIVYSDLDYNMHMNNTKYPDMLCDFLPYSEVNRVKGFFLSYVHESALGDVLTVNHAYNGGVHYFRTVNQNGVTCLEAQALTDGASDL